MVRGGRGQNGRVVRFNAIRNWLALAKMMCAIENRAEVVSSCREREKETVTVKTEILLLTAYSNTF